MNQDAIVIKAAKVKNIPTPSPPRRKSTKEGDQYENENVESETEQRRTNLNI